MNFKVAFILALFFLSPQLIYAQNSVDNTVLLPVENATPEDADVTPDLSRMGLEANLVQIILNDEHRDGVDWAAIVSDFHTTALKKEDNPIWADKKYRLNFGIVSREDYDVLVDALDTVGRMTRFPQQSLDVALNSSSSIALEGQNIRLDVSLTRLKSGELSLHLEPHVALATLEYRNGQKTPVALLLKAQTDMIVKDNTTVVIGGLIKEEEITKTHKFPLLGDIPLVGLVFRSQGRLMQKTETVIFINIHANGLEIPSEKNDN